MRSNDTNPASGKPGLSYLKLTVPPSDEAPRPGVEKGGEEGGGGESPPFAAFAPSIPTNAEFLAVVFRKLPKTARPLVTAKKGDPSQGGWFPYDADKVEAICPPYQNTYFNCASVYPASNGDLRAKKEHAAAYHALVLDDVGTKVERGLLGSITPTWELETSPGNSQIGFVLSTPESDAAIVEEAQHLIVEAGLCDKGALGMMRWVRLPNGINGKPKHIGPDGKPFGCRFVSWNPELVFELDALITELVPDRADFKKALRSASPVAASDKRADT